ncbi:MAG: hypothetical protein KA109_07920 [Saprospiraceae bacterium]|nr:hypothetical protein [Saprospiraceae bacterium]MBK8776886.1 hypothetical protein [Saprospiraceae bacterium]MBP7801529.1 hypothetical protein [Saprospiraceae bacterium]MBP7921256.1 hypothetical protein [Saprospiraceae bacterium]
MISGLFKIISASVMCALLIAVQFACRETPGSTTQEDKSWLDQLILENDLLVPQTIKSQVQDTNHPYYGALPDVYDIPHPSSPSGLIQQLTCAYVSPSSKYFHDGTLLKSMEAGIDYILRCQHEDGTIDLLTTNFHSTPDLAFTVEPTALAYKLLSKDDHEASLTLRQKLKTFLWRGGEALSVGGIHTPNHRWVVSMALARINELFPNEKYLHRIDQWLAEGIDIDADGQYNERSTSVYSPLSDRWLITMARILNRPELFAPVRKNLDMTQYLIHINGDLVTELSKRQDQYTTAPCQAYFLPYLLMGIHHRDTQYLNMARWINTKFGVKALSGNLAYILEDTSVHAAFSGEVQTDYPLKHFERYFEKSALVRWSDGKSDATLIAHNPILFSLQYPDIHLRAVRCAAAFFGKGQFIGDTLYSTQDGYELTQYMEGPYFQPLAKDSVTGDGDWDKMPREKRQQSEVQHLNYKLQVSKRQGAYHLNFSILGTDKVPVAIELNFDESNQFATQLHEVPNTELAYFLEKDDLIIKNGSGRMIIQGGRHDHSWTNLRGALPRLKGKSVYITGFTPFEHELMIQLH